MTVEFHGFTVINATTMPPMKEARGQNKLFQNASLLDVLLKLCDWTFLNFKEPV